MPEFMTPKDIANRVKAKGLQKLRFFCQMCQKQCRDENGFKCHCKSESHLRQMALFAQNPDKFMDSFSTEFEKTFLELLSRRFGSRRVHANIVYNEYIQDKQHAHMNSTMWTTLTEFVKYLGRTGKCTVDEDPEKGWHISWINRDPEAVRRQLDAQKRQERELDDEARYEAEIEAIAEAARRAAAEGALPTTVTEDEDDGEGGRTQQAAGAASAQASHTIDLEKVRAEGGVPAVKISLGLSLAKAGPHVSGTNTFGATGAGSMAPPVSAGAGGIASAVSRAAPLALGMKRPRPEEDSGASTSAGASGSTGGTGGRPMSNMERLMEENLAAKEREKAARAAAAAPAAPMPHGATPSPAVAAGAPGEDWLIPGIIVRVMNRTVGNGAWYKAKGTVTKVVDIYAAHVRLDPHPEAAGGKSVTLKLDVSDVETTCPPVGGCVVLVADVHRDTAHARRGQKGIVDAIHVDRYCADLLIAGEGGPVLLQGVDYEAFSRDATVPRGEQ